MNRRPRTLFWVLHLAWALTAGTVIVLLARERYHLVLWVVLFLAVAWVSTLFFGRTVFADGAAPGLVHEVTSYVTRALYPSATSSCCRSMRPPRWSTRPTSFLWSWGGWRRLRASTCCSTDGSALARCSR